MASVKGCFVRTWTKETKMKITKVFPYLFFTTLAILPGNIGKFNNTDDYLHAKKNIKTNAFFYQDKLEEKAGELCNVYIDFVLRGQKNIKNSRKSHRDAVLSELPGAPVNFHCIFGQYTQLNRAINSLGDTLDIIPFTARNACPRFRSEMQKKYSGPEYAGAIHSGKMMKPNAYKNARDAFLKHNNVTDETPDDIREKVLAKFEQSHFSIETLHPGTILIIQTSANPNNTHAVMYLGRGHVENGNFVPDSTGEFMYAGYNHESVGDIFATFNTNRIFAADIHDISLVAYTKEFEKIKNMGDKELFHFVYDIPNDLYAIIPEHKKLESMATQKYFGKEKPKQKLKKRPIQANTASVGLTPFFFVTNQKTK